MFYWDRKVAPENLITDPAALSLRRENWIWDGVKGTPRHTAEALYYSLSRAVGGGFPVNFTLCHL